MIGHSVKKTLFLLCLVQLCSFFCASQVKAQFVSATLGINGLTCSLCSYGVERELKKLDFIESVHMDLNQNIASIIFIPNKVVKMNEVVTAVYNAGFSVGYTQAVFSFDSISVDENSSFLYQGDLYTIIDKQTQDLDQEKIIRFVNKKFVEPKEYKKWEAKIKASAKNSKALYYIIVL